MAKLGIWGIAVGLATLCLVIGMCFGIWRFWPRPFLEPTHSLQVTDLPAIESAIRLELPDIGAVKAMALIHGKDSTLCLKLVVPFDYGRAMLEAVRARSKPAESSRLSPISSVVPWFRIEDGEKAQVFDEGGADYIAFCDPNAETTTIYVTAGSSSERLSPGVYAMFR